MLFDLVINNWHRGNAWIVVVFKWRFVQHWRICNRIFIYIQIVINRLIWATWLLLFLLADTWVVFWHFVCRVFDFKLKLIELVIDLLPILPYNLNLLHNFFKLTLFILSDQHLLLPHLSNVLFHILNLIFLKILEL